PPSRTFLVRRVGNHNPPPATLQSPTKPCHPERSRGTCGCLCFSRPVPATNPGCPILRASFARRVGNHNPPPATLQSPTKPCHPERSRGTCGCFCFSRPVPATNPGCPILRASFARRVGNH